MNFMVCRVERTSLFVTLIGGCCRFGRKSILSRSLVVAVSVRFRRYLFRHDLFGDHEVFAIVHDVYPVVDFSDDYRCSFDDREGFFVVVKSLLYGVGRSCVILVIFYNGQCMFFLSLTAIVRECL